MKKKKVNILKILEIHSYFYKYFETSFICIAKHVQIKQYKDHSKSHSRTFTKSLLRKEVNLNFRLKKKKKSYEVRKEF